MKEHYKIAFCGLGSIGRRHLKDTVQYLRDHQCSFQIDAVRSGMGQELDKDLAQYISVQYSYGDTIPQDYDIIFITNPTSMHRESIRQYQDCTKSMFIEKPIVDDAGCEFTDLPENLICYVACPMRYMKVLQYVKQAVDCNAAYSVRAICSTYLPNWHPGEDYRQSYSAHETMGGGVEIDLIHEWDYLVWLFGRPDQVKCINRRISELEIDSKDIALYIGSSEKRVYELHLDYFGREEKRVLEIYLPEETLTVDLRKGTIHFGAKQEDLVLFENRDVYQQREIAHFFDILHGECINDNDIGCAMSTLQIAKGSTLFSKDEQEGGHCVEQE